MSAWKLIRSFLELPGRFPQRSSAVESFGVSDRDQTNTGLPRNKTRLIHRYERTSSGNLAFRAGAYKHKSMRSHSFCVYMTSCKFPVCNFCSTLPHNYQPPPHSLFPGYTHILAPVLENRGTSLLCLPSVSNGSLFCVGHLFRQLVQNSEKGGPCGKCIHVGNSFCYSPKTIQYTAT
jgi:hypothetical protein